MKAIYFLVFIILTALLAVAQTPEQSTEQLDQDGRWLHGGGEPWSIDRGKYTGEQAKTFLKRWANLEKATRESSNEWEGEYFLPGGETEVESLRWTSESGFALFHASTCMAAVMHLSYGGVYADSAEVMLLPEISMVSPGEYDDYFLDVLRAKYIPVKWDGAHYLVPEKDIRSFFNMFAGRSVQRDDTEPSYVQFLQKGGDEGEHDSLDNVIVPYGYDKYIKKPIQASITKIRKQKIVHGTEEYNADQKSVVTPVVINAGSAIGVKVGMKFNILSSADDDPIEVKRVFKDYSIGIITRPFYDGTETDAAAELRQKLEKAKISVGWKLTTFSRYPMY